MGTRAEFLQIKSCVLETLIKYPDLTDFYLEYKAWDVPKRINRITF